MKGEGLTWTVALIGGVGGTLTILCYGYWIREKNRNQKEDLGACRIDLAVAYAMTALFGMAMVVIGSRVMVDGKGALLVVNVADRLGETLGLAGKWAFLIGAWGAVFSSLLGVWQAVPYIFADFCAHIRRKKQDRCETEINPISTRTTAYRIYLFAIAFIPMLGLFMNFKEIQKIYSVIGSLFHAACGAQPFATQWAKEMGGGTT